MFGRHPKLAIDALLGLNFDEIQSKSRNEYVKKLKDRLTYSYAKAKEAAEDTAMKNKELYDRRSRASNLQPGDIVLARNVTIRGKHKIADKYETEPYIILEQPNKDTPVYVIKKKNSTTKKTKTLHRNLLLPIKTTVTSDNNNNSESTEKYIIPQRRQMNSEHPNTESSTNSERPKRQRRVPKWQSSGDWTT
jgi:hypothetical protein